MPFGRRSPLEALALPGVILAYKYSQFRQRRREAADRRVTERELSALHNKIDKLLSKLEESEPEPPTSQEDECVICINARATMQTSPCGHRVVCRRCFVKTIQSAVAQRLLPLRCVICRARVNRLITSSGTWRIQESASSYSMGNKTWSGVSGSPSSYSVDGGVAASASLYSMSSGSSYASGVSSNTSNSTNSSDKSSTSSHHHISASSLQTNNNDTLIQHQHPHGSCTIGCSGAIPRTKSINRRDSRYTRSRISELPPIKEFKSPTRSLSSIKTAAPINPNTITIANPTVINPKIRFASYTQKSAPQEIKPLLLTENSVTVKKSIAKSRLNGARVAPLSTNTTNTNKMISNSTRKYENNSSTIINKNILARTATARNLNNLRNTNNNNNNNNKNTNNLTIINNTSFNTSKNTIITNSSINKMSIPHQIRNTITTSNNNNNNNNNNNDEKSDNKKNECIENKKKDDKLKMKAEKDAKKEEKRLAKEEERLAKHMAKEEKKKYKNKDDKELLLVNLKK